MTGPVSVTREGHRTWLKWHRARRRAADPVFTGRRILEGMQLGASVEVDLVVTADKGFAVLHDTTLDRETTGTGAVAATGDAAIRTLRLRGNDGSAIDEPVMLLDDLCALMATRTVHPDALLQLDYKEDETVLDDRAIANFAKAIGPVAKTMIVSSGSAAAVKMLTDAVPGIRIGYDPCDPAVLKALERTRDFAGFVTSAMDAALSAEMIYLYYEAVLAADRAGFNMIAAFHEYDVRIDAWTIRTVDGTTLPQVERLLALKVDQITTDDPEGLAAALGASR